jgi:hypothetical protein
VTVLVMHDAKCPNKGMGHSDAAKRVADVYTLHRIAAPYENLGKWIAVSIQDGRSDNVLYDSKYDAVRHQHHNELWYAFLPIGMHDVTVCDAEIFLRIHRKMFDKGIKMVDRDSVRMPEPIKRATREDQAAQMRSITSGGRLAPSNLIIGGR